MVELDEIAFDQPALAGDPVDHLLVHRDADVLGKAVQPDEGARRSAFLGLALGYGVELIEGDSRLGDLRQLLEHLVHDEARLPHDGDLVRALDFDPHHLYSAPSRSARRGQSPLLLTDSPVHG